LREVEEMGGKCYFCNISPFGETSNIAQQQFNDGTISNIKLNPYGTDLLTVDTWNVPIKGREANKYTVSKKINFCPMCGRKLIEGGWGIMAGCEKCWGNAYMRSRMTGKAQHECYLELLEERKNKPCTPQEQAGEYWDEENQRDKREVEVWNY
jgi:hypothetical protein